MKKIPTLMLNSVRLGLLQSTLIRNLLIPIPRRPLARTGAHTLTMSTAASPNSRSASPPHKRARLSPEQASKASEAANSPTGMAAISKAVASSKKTNKKKKGKAPPPPEPGSAEDVNLHDIYSALGSVAVQEAAASRTEYEAPIELFTEIELTVADICSHGPSCPSVAPLETLERTKKKTLL